MANMIRSAKSGNAWTENELAAYNIRVVEQSSVDFFGVEELPSVPASLHAFVATEDRSNATDDETHKLLHHVDLAQTPREGEEVAVNVFLQQLLSRLCYTESRRIIMIGQEVPLVVCGSNCSAQTDVCLIDGDNILLLVKEDKRLDNHGDPEPQLIAEAIAVFQRNNYNRVRVALTHALDTMIIPAIAMDRTFPVFYKIAVTTSLNDAVKAGAFPEVTTTVYRHTPRLPHHNREGMKRLDNRPILLQCFEVFKAFVSSF